MPWCHLQEERSVQLYRTILLVGLLGVRLVASPGALAQALAERVDLLVARAEVAVAEAMIQKEKAEGRWDASVNVGYMRQDFGYDLRGLTASGGARPIQDVFHYVGASVSVTLPVRNQNQGNAAVDIERAVGTLER
jgi:outer membrane protein TolC